MSETKQRQFIVWAEVRDSNGTIETPAGASDAECEAACREALELLISNGDTGWNELDADGSES